MYILVNQAILFLTIIPGTYCWGRQAHFITAKIALSFLTEDGVRLLEDILVQPGSTVEQSLYEASIWPDFFASDAASAWSRPMHFINIPDRVCDGFNLTRDCGNSDFPGICLATAITNYTSRVIDRNETIQHRREAIKFLVHFTADVTQPMHVGFIGDRGGNKLKVYSPWENPFDRQGNATIRRRTKPLHFIWDNHILQFLLHTTRKNWAQLADDMVRVIKGEGFVPEMLGVAPLSYASLTAAETARISCDSAYKDQGAWIKSGDTLSIDYYRDSSAVVLQQLSLAGLDIARYINSCGSLIPMEQDFSPESPSVMDISDDDWESVIGSPDYENEFNLF